MDIKMEGIIQFLEGALAAVFKYGKNMAFKE